MIVVFPLLFDSSVSPNIIPGICATLERFAVIYKMDYILKWGGLPLNSRLISWTKDGLNSLAQAHGIPTAGLFESNILNESIKDEKEKVSSILTNRFSDLDTNAVKNLDTKLNQIDTAYKHGKTFSTRKEFESMGADDLAVMTRIIGSNPEKYSDSTKDLVHNNFKRALGGLGIDTKWLPSSDRDLSKLGKEERLKKTIDKEFEIEKEKRGTERDIEKERRQRELERKEKAIYYRSPDRSVRWSKGELTSTISIEPTWIQTQSSKGTAIIGVKVVPYPIDPAPFVYRMMQDMSLSFYDEVLERYERGITRLFAKIMRWKIIPKFKKVPIKKDPFEDIIYARSRYAGNIFTLFNLASLENEDMFRDAGGVDKLFRLGWKSILVSDDVTKRVMFCMQEFGGICSVVNYSYLYASLGGTYAKEYGALEDLKKSSSPFFRSKIKPKKLFGESYVNKTISRFSGLSIPCIDGDCK